MCRFLPLFLTFQKTAGFCEKHQKSELMHINSDFLILRFGHFTQSRRKIRPIAFVGARQFNLFTKQSVKPLV